MKEENESRQLQGSIRCREKVEDVSGGGDWNKTPFSMLYRHLTLYILT